ncbi:glycosyltransferase [Tessaracoccus oleiagri]|uniref:Glycosyltransferase involved in cell wall bisynthesis n=1 Tax=Tessaracoccus oleiagri TaxID=686624 RepID=A0A1G9H945_9ACTN|nr:glycosyltransferase [Tessaracoccus oleiagri]SDL09460.1 Glycosyltransferase involved in cell wall bisynthesis [Tessaracoccus oleiagri]
MTRPLKVAQFTDNYGPGSNGLMVAVQQLEGNLLDAGHEVIVVAPAAKGVNPHHGREGRTEIRLPSVRVPRLPTNVANGRHFERTIEQLATIRPDVMHVHGFGTVGALGMWAAARLRIPMMVTWHTDFDAYADHYAAVLPLLTGVLRAFARMSKGGIIDHKAMKDAEIRYEDRGRSTASLLGLCAKMLESADLVTTPSPKTVNRALQLAPNANIICVPNGVDPLPPGPPPMPRGEGPLILYAGRIAPEKGLPLLLQAFELVRAQRPDAQLMVVGDWQRYPKIKKALAAARDRLGVILPGEQKREALGAFYGMADLFAFPSQTDTQALVLHEAALAGLPIVAVDHELQLVLEPGVNGELARPTPASFASAIMRVLRADDEWRANATKRSIELASQWTVQSQADEMLRLYQLVAEGRGADLRPR